MDRQYSLIDLQTNITRVMREIRSMQQEDLPEIIFNLMKPYNDRLDAIEKISQVSKLNLCFVGEVGVGKTMFLSHFLGLVDDLKEEKNVDEITLLKTGIGRTTLCETVIKQVEEKTNISVEGLELEEFSVILDDFAESILPSDEGNILSEELKIALENMSSFPTEVSKLENAKLKEEKLDKKEILDRKKKIILEEQLEYINKNTGESISKISRDEKQLLINALANSIDYPNRVNNLLIFDSTNNFKDWVKSNFESINAGNLKDCPLPKRIVININEKDFKLNLPKSVASVIDSKGMDGPATRTDIVDTIFDVNNMVVLCDRIESYGNILNRDWLKSSLTRNQDINQKCLILGLERYEELGEDRILNMEKKEKQILGQNKSFFETSRMSNNNLFFVDSMHGYSVLKKRIIDINREEYNIEWEDFDSKIESMIKNMHHSLVLEVKNIGKQLSALRQSKLDDTVIEKLSKCKAEIAKYMDDLYGEKNFSYDELRSRLSGFHAATVRGSVNRNGFYYNCNIYSESGQIGINILEELNKDKIYAFKKFIDNNDVFDKNNPIENTIFESIKYKLDQEYITLKNVIEKDYSSLLENGISQSSIWDIMYYFWGDGNGNYRERVINTIMKEVDANKINSILCKNNYKERLFKSIFDFINI